MTDNKPKDNNNDPKIIKNQDLDKAKTELLKRAMPQNTDTPEKQESNNNPENLNGNNKTNSSGSNATSTNNTSDSGNTDNTGATNNIEASSGGDGNNSNLPPQNLPSDDSGADDSSDGFFTGTNFKPGTIVPTNIVDEMKKDYIDYAMSVIVSRALPDVRDGLKPSQRRILVAMSSDLQLWPKGSFRKSAKIVGETVGNYHPHGDQAVYTTMVNMAQDFSMRYPLVHGQGNFGSIDGDSPAQMRYTEAKLTKIAVELLKDLDKGTVSFIPNYDGTRNEPTVLPAAFPNLFANGADGIAVGMATKIPPHNLGELIDAVVYMIDKKNNWKGKAIYNDLRKWRESTEKIPMLLPKEPLDLLESYLHKDNPNFKAQLKNLHRLLKNEETNEKELSEIFENFDQLKKVFEHEQNSEISLYPKFVSAVTIDELMQFIKGPDFPTGGAIYNKKQIAQVYETGRGKIVMRGIAKVEEDKKGKQRIVITEIPYQVNKAVLVEQIAKLVQLKKITGIKDLRDESNKEGIRIVIELKNSATPKVIINKLYKYTPLQLNYNANMIALVYGEPKTLTLKRYLELYIEHRSTVTIRKLEFELASSKYKDHILQGLLKALDFIDEVIKTIRASKTQEEAKQNLIEKFELTSVQAQAILDMQLRRLAALERQKIEAEHKELLETIKHHEEYLASEDKILELIKQGLLEIKEKYADKRKTKVYKGSVEEPEEEDLIAEELTFITISDSGYIKRLSLENYRTQKRGGRGTSGASLKENDYIKHALVASTHDTLLVFTQDGRVYALKVYEIPEYRKNAKGLPIVNLLPISRDTKVSAVLPLDKQTLKTAKYLTMATAKGMVKRTALKEYLNIRKNGLNAISLKPGDTLIDVLPTQGDAQLILVTKNGKAIRFTEDQIRATGRNTAGVRGIKLKGDDQVISMDIVENNRQLLLTVSNKGYAKMTKLSKFKQQQRGGTGVFAFKVSDKKGYLMAAKVLNPSQVKPKAEEPDKKQLTDEEIKEQAQAKAQALNPGEIMLISKKAVVIRTTLKNIPILNRQTSGVITMRVKGDDEVVSVVV